MAPPATIAPDVLPHRLDLPSGNTESVRRVPSTPGVFLLTDAENQPILLAQAKNIRRVIMHRLTARDPGERTRRADLSAVVRRIHWRETFSDFESTWIHYRAARALYPRSYRDIIGFAPAGFIRVDTAAAFPRFTSVERIRADTATYIGPTPTPRDADEWIQTLEDAFDLCRYFHVLEKSPHGERCAYFDMGKCPAPCDGTVSMEAYRQSIREAVRFTLGDRDNRLAQLRAFMSVASGRLEFERAAAIRKTIERAETVAARPEFRHMADLFNVSWLVIQRASRPSRKPERQHLRPFFIRDGVVHVGGDTRLSEVEKCWPLWRETVMGLSGADGKDSVDDICERPATREKLLPPACEIQSWVARFLFRREKPEGVFLRADSMPSTADALARIADVFSVGGATASPDLPPN